MESFVPIREYRLLYRMIEVVVSHFTLRDCSSIQLLTEPFQQIKGRVERDSSKASRVLFQKSAVTRTKVETGTDWTNVIIPGEHKSYNNKQVRQ